MTASRQRLSQPNVGRIRFLALIWWFTPAMAQNATNSPSTMLMPTLTPSLNPSSLPVVAPSDLSLPTTDLPTVDVDDSSSPPSGMQTTSPTALPTGSPPAAQTGAPTSTPSKAPTAFPTSTPTAAPTTMAPSASPTPPRVMIPVESIVPLELQYTPSLLIGSAKDQFLFTTETFLEDQLPEVASIFVSIARQFRKPSRGRQLQNGDPLFVDLNVMGILVNDVPNYDFEAVLLDVFESMSVQYVGALKLTGDPYFVPLEEVAISLTEDTQAPVVAPTLRPTFNDDGSDQDEPSDGFPLGAIIGVAVAVVLIIAIVGWLVKDKMSRQSGPKKQKETSTPLALADDKAPHNQGIQQQESDADSQALYSYAQGDNSVMGGSIMQNDSIMGADTMSYAYSLEPGGDLGTVDGSSLAGTVPMEIPQFRANQRMESGASSYVSSTRDSEFGMEPTLDNESLVTADLKLSESEIAMLPSNLGKDTAESETNDPPTRQVIAPPGKLGIVIDTTVEGPVVHYVNENSALVGKIWAGDIIVAIDDVDTRAMSASAITDLMVKTANQQRILTVVGGSKD